MTKNQIYENLISIASEVFEVPRGTITKDLQAGMIEQWDSLGHLRLFMAIEEKFKIKFLTEKIVELSSIEKIADNIQEMDRFN